MNRYQTIQTQHSSLLLLKGADVELPQKQRVWSPLTTSRITEIYKSFWYRTYRAPLLGRESTQSSISFLDTSFIVSPVLVTSCSAQRCPTDCDSRGYFWSQQQLHEGAAIPWRSVPACAGRAGQSPPDLCGPAIPSPLPTLLTWAQPSPKASGMQMLQMHFPQGTLSALGFIFS